MNNWIKSLVVVLPLAGGVTVPVFAEEPAAKEEAPKQESIDFRKLRDILPEKLGGLERTSREGSRNRVGELSISQAQASYGKDDGKNASIDVLDYGQNNPAAAMFAHLAQVEIDRESENEYERSVKVEGAPGIERYNSEQKEGSVQLYVADRYTLNFTASGVTKEEFQALIKDLPIKALAELK